MKTIIVILILFLTIPFTAYADWCGILNYASEEAAEKCRENQENKDDKRKTELRKKEKKRRKSYKKSSGYSKAPSLDQKAENPMESKFEFGFNLPIYFLFPFQQGAPGYMLVTQITQLRVQYNFSEFMHVGGSYIDQKIEALPFEDTTSSFYNNTHWVVYGGMRGWIEPERQVVVNIGATRSDSYPEGGTTVVYETGLYAEAQLMFVFDSLKIGPSLTVIISAAKDAKLLQDNKKASFIRFGINGTFGLPFGYVGDW